MLKLELGETLPDICCDGCGGIHKTAYGFIYRDDDAYGVYFATLHTGHAEPTVGLTLSLGKWWDDEAVDERQWVFLNIFPKDDQYHMSLVDPTRSQHATYQALGKSLDRDAALDSELRDDFFSVADYIVVEDPAVASYLATGVVDIERWQHVRAEQPNFDDE
jgi:hypothetical protein